MGKSGVKRLRDKPPFKELFLAAGKDRKPNTLEDFLRPDGPLKYLINGRPNQQIDDVQALETGNHAFYFGKIPIVGTETHIGEILGFEAVERGTYNPQVVGTAMDYAVLARKDSKTRVKFVIGACLSRIFNGEDSMVGHLTSEQEKELFKKIAKSASLKDEQVEITCFEEMPSHQALFDVVKREQKEAQDRGEDPKYLDAIINAETEEAADPASSLEIAKVIIKAARNSAYLTKELSNTSPHSKTNTGSGAMDYTIVEISMRISDLLHGCYIQGGVDRQRMYDRFIIEFIRGRKGNGKIANVQELYPIFDLLEGQQLHALHVNKKNYRKKGLERTISRTRLSIWTVIITAISLSIASVASRHGEILGHEKGVEEGIAKGFESGKKVAREEYFGDMNESAMDFIDENLRSATFYNGSEAVEKSHNSEVVLEFLNLTMKELQMRYNIKDDEFLISIKPLLIQFIVQEKDKLPQQRSPQGWGKYKLTFLADQFFAANKILFASHGYTDIKPYAQMSELLKDESLIIDDVDEEVEQTNVAQLGLVGSVNHPLFPQPVEIYLHRNKFGEARLVTLETENISYAHKARISTKKMLQVKEALQQDLGCFSVLPLRFEYKSLFEYEEQSDEPANGENERLTNLNANITPLADIRDDDGELMYTIAVYGEFNPSRETVEKHLLAKAKGEKLYSRATLQKAIPEINRRLYPWTQTKSR